MPFTIMLTSAGGEMIPFLIRNLKESDPGIRVLAVDAGDAKVSKQFADGIWQVPFGRDAGYVDAILGILRANPTDLLVPCSDEEALALSRRRTEIEALGCRVASVEYETLQTFSDKAACYRALERIGIEPPMWHQVDEPSGLLPAVEDILSKTGGCVLKPAVGRGGRDVLVIRHEVNEEEARAGGGRERHLTLGEFTAVVRETPSWPFPMIAMEQLRAPVFDIDMLAWQGTPVHVIPRRRVSSQLPNEGHVYVDAPELVALGRRLIEGFSLSWLYDCDVMYDSAGKPRVLEINPRPSGSAAVTVAAGVPLFTDLIALCRGAKASATPPTAGVTVLPYKALLRI